MEQTDIVEMPVKRTQFLTILCILTFIGAGFGFLIGLYNLKNAPYAVDNYERMQEMSADMGDTGGFIGTVMEYERIAAINPFPLAITRIVANFFCLLGAFMMWKLRKIGFYGYLFGELLGLIVPIVLIGFVGFVGVFEAIFPIAFIVMYAVNFKQMS